MSVEKNVKESGTGRMQK